MLLSEISACELFVDMSQSDDFGFITEPEDTNTDDPLFSSESKDQPEKVSDSDFKSGNRADTAMPDSTQSTQPNWEVKNVELATDSL